MSTQAILTTAAVVGALTVIGEAARRIWPTIRKVGHIIDDVAGEPARPGVEARPGLMERVGKIEEFTRGDFVHRLDDAAEQIAATVARLDDLDRGQLEILSRQDRTDEEIVELTAAIRDSQRDRSALWRVLERAQLSRHPVTDVPTD